MARFYLDPEDVGPADARMVLDFLNAAGSAEEIASAVEIAGELDIGIRLAQRILDRRAELGEFTSLQQIADVPLIGPERFTEIVTTLSAARVPQAGVPAGIDEELRALRRDVDALRAGAGTQPSLTLRTLQPEPYLGQSVNVVARATEPGSDRSLIGATVVVATTWGRLRGVEGVQLREGQSLRLRTGVDGAARAVLLPPTTEDVFQAQQATLEVALQALDPDARTPADTRTGLESLARRYRREGENVFRRAVDVYFRDFGGQAREPINVSSPLAAWSYFETTLVAYLPDAEQGSSVRATAVLPLWVRDWLTPWLEVHESLARGDAALDNELVDFVRTRIDQEAVGSILGRVYGRIREYVDDQRGVVGEFVGRKVAERSLTAVLDAGLVDASPAARIAIFPGAEAGTRLLATASASVLAGIGDARADLRRDLEPRLDADFGDLRSSLSTVESQLSTRGDEIGTLTGRLSSLETTVDGKADLSRVTALESADLMRAESLTALSAQLGAVSTQLDDFRLELDLRLDPGQFAAFQEEIGGQLTSIRNDFDQRLVTFANDLDRQLDAKADLELVSALETSVSVVTQELATFDTRLDGVETSVDGKLDATQFASFEADVSRQLDAKADLELVSALETSVSVVTQELATFDARLDGVQTSVDGKLDATQFASFEADVSLQLDAKADLELVSALETSVSVVTQELATIDTRLDGVQTSVDGKLDATQFASFEADVSLQLDAKADAVRVSTLESQVSTTTTQIGALQNTTSRLDRSLGTLSTSVSGLSTDMTTLRRNVDPRLR